VVRSSAASDVYKRQELQGEQHATRFSISCVPPLVLGIT
jgi:hypothetical protein